MPELARHGNLTACSVLLHEHVCFLLYDWYKTNQIAMHVFGKFGFYMGETICKVSSSNCNDGSYSSRGQCASSLLQTDIG